MVMNGTTTMQREEEQRRERDADGFLQKEEPPLRMEVFSAEQRMEKGRALAMGHIPASGKTGGVFLLERLSQNESALRNARRKFIDDATAGKNITSVGEWLVDNFYIVEEQIGLAVKHLPDRYLSELPLALSDNGTPVPRVYDIAEKIIAYGDGRVDVQDVSSVVAAYQEVVPLKLGELWAIPIMLRLAVVENIRRIAVIADKNRDDRENAARWADEIVKIEADDPKNVIIAVADMARSNPSLTNSFVAEFKRKITARGSGVKLPLQWLEQHLDGEGLNIDDAVNGENRSQAVMEISIRNCITSLRVLNVVDWEDFVEKLSVVESILRKDPAGVYGGMDFNTRDVYRRAVELLAKKSAVSEAGAAERCLELAGRDDGDPLARHVGYYLVGRGGQELKKAIGFKGGIGDFIRTASSRMTLALYLGSIAVLTVSFTAATAYFAYRRHVDGGMLAVLAVLFAVSTAHVAIGLVNFAATLLVKPHPLPRLDFSAGIPREFRTLAVAPVIVKSAKAVETLLKNLETHYLNNRGPFIHFALLTDFQDAPEENMPEDAELLELCRAGIRELNARHPETGGDNFYLFHRPRKWNATENAWMGYERKRGKLEDLNRYLVGKDESAFSVIEGRREELAEVKYVVTLDADTMMARDSAWQLVGTMAHPLVRPVYAENLGRVVSGHGILQPRVDSFIAGACRSSYARLTASECGIDPYTKVSSDVYQDLFDEGSFIGKGIYDVRVFDRALGRRFPDNKILSHDLLEGCVLRSGLVNDVKFYEDPPAAYLADVNRRHRWIRGDWQIASYLFRKSSKRYANPLNKLSRWKIFDNLRRSMTPLFLLVLLVLGLTILSRPGAYVAVVCAVFVIPLLVNSLAGLVRKSPDKTMRQHFSSLFSTLGKDAARAVFRFACLPFETYVNADAIVRSLWRQCVSGRLLLQWTPSDNRQTGAVTALWPILKAMWIGPVFAAAMTCVLYFKNPGLLPYALPLFLLWFLSPLFAAELSRPTATKRRKLDARQTDFLRKTARRTWLFFETYVNADNAWLPPDNYQEFPHAKVARRTSPTNMGLSLLANLSAFDFGFVPCGQLLERTEKSLASMCRLERHRGHFYNWYDTENLAVLRPAYISTVDSGNLAAHLMVLTSGLSSLANEPIAHPRLFLGLLDTVELAAEKYAGKDDPNAVEMEKLRDDLKKDVETPPGTLSAFHARMREYAERAGVLANASGTNAEEPWLPAFSRQAAAIVLDLETLAPWAAGGENASRPSAGDIADLVPTLSELAALEERADDPPSAGASRTRVRAAVAAAKMRLKRIDSLVAVCRNLTDVEFDFLYDKSKRLLAIGYNVDERKLDDGVYDLLASEARLAAYLGIVQHKLPQASWFALGRMLTLVKGRALLVSWSGSMFEYLMPLLVMPTAEETLLDDTYRSVVRVQEKYGDGKGMPWGISESGYNVFDSSQNYQYRAFGVPELGLRHCVSDDLVIAPYAACLACMVDPEAACRNLRRLADEGMLADYGFYEAADYTPSRKPRGEEKAIVRSFMVHHQAMSLVALGQALLDRPMHRRFMEHPLLRSAAMLLEEIVPDPKAMYFHSSYTPEIRAAPAAEESPQRVVVDPNTPHPEIQLLSNGDYSVMLTAAGAGYSRWRDIAVTRWREDATRDNWGSFCFIRDRDRGGAWSTTHQPMPEPGTRNEAIFSEGKAEFNRRNDRFDAHTEIVVSPEDDVEVKRIRIVNRTNARQRLDLTTFAEVVLSSAAADDSHQAFNKLFVETRILGDRRAVLCSRRPRNPDEKTPRLFHMLLARTKGAEEPSYETDRLRFVGRDNDLSRAAALLDDREDLSNTDGAVLDPAVAIRVAFVLEPDADAHFDVVAGVAESDEAAFALIEKYHDERMVNKAFDLAWTHGQLLLRQLNVTETEAQSFCRLAGSIVYANPAMRADPEVLARNFKGQSGLWGYSISGDLPIALVEVADPERAPVAAEAIQAHSYWRQKGLAVDLVIWNNDQSGYRQSLHDQLTGLAVAAMGESNLERPGGIFIRSIDRIAEEDKTLIRTAARLALFDKDGSLKDRLRRQARRELSQTVLLPGRRRRRSGMATPPAGDRELLFANGYGGFSPDGREYVVLTGPGTHTPAPWVNVMANENFGSAVSASGSSHTWSENAHEFRLTPWHNDPVTDPTGEAIYLRDEVTGDYWSPTPAPCGGGWFTTRHGFGYSVFEHEENGVFSELTVHVDREAPVKYMTLKVRNDAKEKRVLSAVCYVEWVLGDLRAKTAMHVATGVDSSSGALFARNHYAEEFRGRTAFLDTDDPGRTFCGDRREFIGRNGNLLDPAALRRTNLSGRVGAGLDPCGAVRVKFQLPPGKEKELVFRLGTGKTVESARRIVQKTRGLAAAKASLERVKTFWRETVGTLRMETPDPAFNLMANGWLLYQSLSCRFWGRSATYQSGGAFGFRDQLQDSLAFLYSNPNLVRRHLLLCAEHQFVEGDAMHWWHPPGGRGVRTRCSDDYLWLPYAAQRYVQVTDDWSVLDEEAGFLQGRPLRDDEESYYDLPGRAAEKTSLYEHCKRAILHGMRFGTHGLPLMGSGDWNDGMDRVGIHGKGESVWLAFFLHVVLTRFAGIASARGDDEFARHCLTGASRLETNIEANAWDDLWYRRAYFDDGTPLGSALNPECRIDSIAQSWAVISGAADRRRAAVGMNSLYERLVDKEHMIVKLFEPPFDSSNLNPGYIKGYVPGVRENGGQYTHGAVWAAIAFAELGDGDRAWELCGLINPVNHALSKEDADRYKIEPYVIAADVYAETRHAGRGGWSWYTGSASWFYRFLAEWIVGFDLRGDSFSVKPCLPPQWNGLAFAYKRGETRYRIEIGRSAAKQEEQIVMLDGVRQKDGRVHIVEDGREHAVEVLV